MGEVKLATWNMEWLNDLFVTEDQPAAFRPDDAETAHDRSQTVGGRKALLRRGFLALEALGVDIIVVVEGPSRQAELDLAFRDLAPGQWTTFLQRSVSRNSPLNTSKFTSQQNCGVAVRTDTGKFADPAMLAFDAMEEASGAIHDATEPFHFDTGQNGVVEWYRFERRPAYVEIALADGGRFRIVGVHLKSKLVATALEWSRWWTMADANRERLLAQCRHLREEFLDPYLTAEATRDIPIIVCGDVNDGPGFDSSEMRLHASGVETLMGSVWRPGLTLGNALYDTLDPKDQAKLNFEDLYTTRFEDPIFDGVYQQEWIDHVLYSRAHGRWVDQARIIRKVEADGFPFYKISDHYPVMATIRLPA